MNDVTWEDVKRQRGLSSQGSAEYAAAEYAFQLGLRVRQLRKERKWSQKELAERTGMSQPSRCSIRGGWDDSHARCAGSDGTRFRY